jgi:hypothetical protein
VERYVHSFRSTRHRRLPTGHCSPASGLSSLASRRAPQAPRPCPPATCRELGSFPSQIPPWFVLSRNMPMTNNRAIWLRSGAFLSPPCSSLQFHWPLTTGHLPLFSRSTPHPRPSPYVSRFTPHASPAGSGHAQTLPRWLPPVNRPPNYQGPNGARSRRAAPLFHYVTEPGDSCGQIDLFFLARRDRTVDHSLLAGGVQPQWLQACLADGHQTQCLASLFPRLSVYLGLVDLACD